MIISKFRIRRTYRECEATGTKSKIKATAEQLGINEKQVEEALTAPIYTPSAPALPPHAECSQILPCAQDAA
jgi:hypothetical protein